MRSRSKAGGVRDVWGDKGGKWELSGKSKAPTSMLEGGRGGCKGQEMNQERHGA